MHLCKVHLKSIHARLAVDYTAYSMVICQVIDKFKLVLLFAVQYLGKNDSYFCLLRHALKHSARFKSDRD